MSRPTPHGNTARLGLTIPREPARFPSQITKVMPAKYPGTCKVCGYRFSTGESIVWTRGSGSTCAGGHRARRSA